jgi:hypothetical protein
LFVGWLFNHRNGDSLKKGNKRIVRRKKKRPAKNNKETLSQKNFKEIKSINCVIPTSQSTWFAPEIEENFSGIIEAPSLTPLYRRRSNNFGIEGFP